MATETEDVEQLVDLSSKRSAMDYLLSNEVDDRWCEIAAALLLYDDTAADDEVGNEADDKEYDKGYVKENAVERLIEARFEHYSKDPISRNVARSIYGRHMEGSITRQSSRRSHSPR